MTPTDNTHPPQAGHRGGWVRWTVWLAGLAVALGAGVATAHGLYEVALAAGTPRPLAWLYPLITDGLALVAYATTTRLSDHGRRYAWTVVVVAAGLSGLTQASYLAGSVASAPPALRFAIGAWPAIAAAIVAHLLYLLGTTNPPTTQPQPPPVVPASLDTTDRAAVSPADPAPLVLPMPAAAPSPLTTAVEPAPLPATQADRAMPPPLTAAVQPPRPLDHALDSSRPIARRVEHQPGNDRPAVRTSNSPAADRAQAVAREHAARHGQLPTVSELVTLARVARGTAATALKHLRHQPDQRQIATTTNTTRSHQ